jgi:hypothetical protein
VGKFIGTLNQKTPSKTVWDKIRQIYGKRKTHQIRHMITSNGVKTDDPKMMADELAKQFSKAGACTTIQRRFQKEKGKEIKKTPPCRLQE